MSDYIKREDVLRAFNGSCNTADADDILRHLHKSIKIIESLPFADVVEVVRCKDCKHMHESLLNGSPFETFCDVFPAYIHKDDYCSYGERADT